VPFMLFSDMFLAKWLFVIDIARFAKKDKENVRLVLSHDSKL